MAFVSRRFHETFRMPRKPVNSLGTLISGYFSGDCRGLSLSESSLESLEMNLTLAGADFSLLRLTSKGEIEFRILKSLCFSFDCFF